MLNGRRGLTLIELVVVIAIIMSLMAVSLPAIRRVRREARAVICQSNLRQWGTIWDVHTTDNGGRFLQRLALPAPVRDKVEWAIVTLEERLAN